MKTTTIPTTPSPEVGHFKTDHVLNVGSGRYHLGGWTKDGVGRIKTGAGKVAGPYAFAIRACTVIAANPAQGTAAESRRKQAEGTEHVLEIGDFVLLAGTLYEIVKNPSRLCGDDKIALVAATHTEEEITL